jgi:hypothetical protein
MFCKQDIALFAKKSEGNGLPIYNKKSAWCVLVGELNPRSYIESKLIAEGLNA